MRKHLLVALLIPLSMLVRAQGQAPKVFTFNLQECLEYAWQNQDSIKNARLDIESANYRVKETIGLGLPQVSGSAQFQDYLKLPTTLLPGDFVGQPGVEVPVTFGVKYQSNVGLAVNQLIFSGSYLVGLRASRTYKELSERNLNRTRISTTVNVSKAYYMVLTSNEQIRLLDANLSQLSQQLKETTELNRQGFVEKIDLDRLRVIYNNLQTDRNNTQRLLSLSTQMLKFQMGMPVTDELQVKDKIANIQIDSTATVALDTSAYRNRVEYGLLETQRKLNDLNVQRLKSEYLPTLSAFGNTSYIYQANNFSDLYARRFPTTVVGLQLNVPIFTGFQKLNQVRQAAIEVRKSDNLLNNARNGILLQQEAARITYSNSIQSLNNQRNNMNVAREVLRVSRIKYQEGVGSSLEVTQAQTALEEAENHYIQALYDALISKVDLENAYGRIN
jgi:outer membrane protein